MSSEGVTAQVKGYEAFFGFRDAPFSLAPNTRFLFDSASHAAARSQVAYALERREPVVVVTGAIGTGKTLLCRSVVERLERRTFLSIIHDPTLGQDELLKQMLQDFGVISKDRTKLTPTTRHDLTHALQEFLLSLVPLQAHAVLVIDEHLQPQWRNAAFEDTFGITHGAGIARLLLDNALPERTWHSHIGMAPGGATKSATPAVMALRGIESNLAELGSCASVTPPASWIARRPAVPSVPMPENTTPAAAWPFSAARVRKKESIG